MTHPCGSLPRVAKAVLLLCVLVDSWSPKPPTYRVDAGDDNTHISLYPGNGAVEALFGTDGHEKFTQDPDTVWIVEYYDTSCPHCWYFSSIFAPMARALK